MYRRKVYDCLRERGFSFARTVSLNYGSYHNEGSLIWCVEIAPGDIHSKDYPPPPSLIL